jgi:hypothetical protein
MNQLFVNKNIDSSSYTLTLTLKFPSVLYLLNECRFWIDICRYDVLGDIGQTFTFKVRDSAIARLNCPDGA